MKIIFCVSLVVLMNLPFFLVCEVAAQQHHAAGGTPTKETAESEEEVEIQASMAKLAAKDRALAESQGYCPVMTDNKLGTMGAPIKVMVKDQPVFLCCAGCRRRALAAPDKTLATVKELQAKVVAAEIESNLAKLSPEDRQQAEAQGFCPVMPDSQLGAMGTPVKIMVNDEPVFLCCAGCRTKALANPDQTLETVASLRVKVAQAAEQKARVKDKVTE